MKAKKTKQFWDRMLNPITMYEKYQEYRVRRHHFEDYVALSNAKKRAKNNAKLSAI